MMRNPRESLWAEYRSEWHTTHILAVFVVLIGTTFAISFDARTFVGEWQLDFGEDDVLGKAKRDGGMVKSMSR